MAMATLCVVMFLALFSCYCAQDSGDYNITYPPEVDALRAIRRKLHDPKKYLRRWGRGDPCNWNWTGVICTLPLSDGYMHVQELRLLNMNLSGKLAPELGQLTNMTVLNFMWNQNIRGTIPKEIGNIKTLKFLLLSGNQLSGPLADELGFLPNLLMFQIDLNQITGSLPISFGNLTQCRHFHMNNNSISGQIPSELRSMPELIHFLLDNNNLTGNLPPEYSQMPNLKILQLDNNNFGGTEIPASYSNMSNLVKLSDSLPSLYFLLSCSPNCSYFCLIHLTRSLRNCNLQGAIPDFSNITTFRYLTLLCVGLSYCSDLSRNRLSGEIPTNKLSDHVTAIDLSYNSLNGSIPSNFSVLPNLQKLSLEGNFLSGQVPSVVWQNENFTATARLIIDLRNNSLSNISGSINPPSNVTIRILRLEGNPVCASANQLNIARFCGNTIGDGDFVPGTETGTTSKSSDSCPSQSCPVTNNYEYVPDYPGCFCAAPFGVGLRLRSPPLTDFNRYIPPYKQFITSNLGLELYQLVVELFVWQAGPRLRLFLKFYPNNNTFTFNKSEIGRIRDIIATFAIPSNDTFGPYEVIDFTLGGPYSDYDLQPLESGGISKGALTGIILGAISFVVAVSLAITLFFYKRGNKSGYDLSKKQPCKSKSGYDICIAGKVTIATESVKEFSFLELEEATGGFKDTAQVGQGGYGKVYKGILTNGTVVAIKRAQQGSLQGQTEFITEIQLMSRLHHRNLVSLIGYCNEQDEQMLVYEFMPNGSLHDHLSGASTHVSTLVKGTPGYLDPEYFLTHKLTDKSDVYSLGVVFLELLTGMLPISHGRNIVREVYGACQSGLMFSIIDQSMGAYSSECVKKFMALALKCCLDDPKQRPTMLEVVRELENLCLQFPETDTVPTLSESDASNSNPSPLLSGRNSQPTTEILGSELMAKATLCVALFLALFSCYCAQVSGDYNITYPPEDVEDEVILVTGTGPERMLNLNLSGKLAPELGQLTNMTVLNFMWNQNITGTIPKEIGNIKTLEFLLLSGNQLSGPLADELGFLPNLLMFQVNLNQITGSLPKSFVNLTKCMHFHMNNNSISGQIPSELHSMPELIHFLLDNNNLTGNLPPEYSQMPNLKILQLDNNNFGGTEIPASYSNMSILVKLSDSFPTLYFLLSCSPNCSYFCSIHLTRSLRNCNLQGAIPDFSNITTFRYLTLLCVGLSYCSDLSRNSLTGEIPTNKLSDNVTAIDLSYNSLNGSIPSNFSVLPNLQKLSLEGNFLSGDVPSDFWQNENFTANATLFVTPQKDLDDGLTGIFLCSGFGSEADELHYPVQFDRARTSSLAREYFRISLVFRGGLVLHSVMLVIYSIVLSFLFSASCIPNLCPCAGVTCRDFRNNSLSNISGSINPPSNVTIRLEGNPVCASANQLNIAQFCGNTIGDEGFIPGSETGTSSNSSGSCQPNCPLGNGFEFVPDYPGCFCAAPLAVGLRLQSPPLVDFNPYIPKFKQYFTHSLGLELYQLHVKTFVWRDAGPRLRLFLNFFPQYNNYTFTKAEMVRIIGLIATFAIPPSDTFGPYVVIDFTPSEAYSNYDLLPLPWKKGGISKGALAGLILGAISFVVAVSLAITLFFYKRGTKSGYDLSKKQPTGKVTITTEGVKDFSFSELEAATGGFKDTAQIGQGGYGKVYKGILANGTVVAIKRAQQGSLQGQTEFITEIQLMSRLHHRNMVSLIGYCSEQDEQMLVYEFMPNGSLHDLLSDRYRDKLSFPMRLNIALGSAKGILYLHNEAYPPIIHRDIKANNIFLDFKFIPKVSDFGISRLAPLPDAEGASTHVSTLVKGTPGYLDLEYFLTHKLTDKSDVYSLGVVFLELLTGMMPISHGRNIVREVLVTNVILLVYY
ncbi:hypothetical protein GQ457_14G002160 [Hibiscus cannabinus]